MPDELVATQAFNVRFLQGCCVFKEITLVGLNQRNYFENANAYSQRTLKMRMATRTIMRDCNSALLQFFCKCDWGLKLVSKSKMRSQHTTHILQGLLPLQKNLRQKRNLSLKINLFDLGKKISAKTKSDQRKNNTKP